jgi:BolA protein
MSLETRMRDKITTKLAPDRLDIVNESHMHRGHSGDNGTGETHFRLTIVSAAFAGKSRVDRHRIVNAAVAEELRDGVHALAMSTYAPGEPIR